MMSCSLFFRNLFYAALLPGGVAVLIPFFILGERERAPEFMKPENFTGWAGFAICMAGLFALTDCIHRFGYTGLGTLSPLDPTKKLVAEGLYRFSRNPMYLGVILMVAGQAVYFRSVWLAIYLVGIWISFDLFIRFREEPRLKKTLAWTTSLTA